MAKFPTMDAKTLITYQVIETSASQLYRVAEIPQFDLDHCWFGVPVKRIKGNFVDKANAKVELVRKAATRVVA